MYSPLNAAGISPPIPATKEQLSRAITDPNYAAAVGIPAYKAMIMLQEMNKKPPAQPQTQTVAQQLVAQAEPHPQQAGLSQLPVGDHMFQEKNYAGGGIIAFTPGGGVGDDGMTEAQRKASEDYQNWLKTSLFHSDEPIQDDSKLVLGRPGLNENPSFNFAQPIRENSNFTKPTSGLDWQSQIKPPAPAANPAPAPIGNFSDYLKSPASNVAPTGNNPNVSLAANAATGAEPSLDPMAAMNASVNRFGKQIDEKGIKSLYDNAKVDSKDIAKNTVNMFNELVGPDESTDKLTEKLNKMAEKTKHDEDTAPWMALAQAGFAMAAGKSRFALQNIAEGGTAGLKAYNDAKEKNEAAELQQLNIQNQLNKAQRAEKISAATMGINSQQHIDDLNHATELAKINAGIQIQKDNYDNIIKAAELGPKAELYTGEAFKNRKEGDYYGSVGKLSGKGMLTEDQIAKEYASYQSKLGYKNYPPNMPLSQFAAKLRSEFSGNQADIPTAPTGGSFVTDSKTGEVHYVPATK
jgi:predicted  nucleic acid-binding Zn-ribbon protein